MKWRHASTDCEQIREARPDRGGSEPETNATSVFRRKREAAVQPVLEYLFEFEQGYGH